MKVTETKLRDVWRVEPDVFRDFRGDYFITYHKQLYDRFGIDWVEHDISTSRKGVLRGIHYSPNCWKLYQVLHGAIYYVFVNCDKSDPEYGKWESHLVDDKNHYQFVKHPRYGAGMYVLEDDTVLHYMQSQYYDPNSPDQQTFMWNDPSFNIFWPDVNPILSQRDTIGRYVK